MSFLKLRDLIRARKASDATKETWRDISLAKVVTVGGSIHAGTANIWVVLWGPYGSPTQVFNPGLTLAAGDWVKISQSPKSPYRWSILEYWAGDVDPEYLGRIARHTVGLHGWNHQWPTESGIGADPVRVYQPALQLLKTTGNGTDLEVTIQTLEYNYGGVRRSYLGGTLDLTSSVPSAGNIRAVLIYLDMAWNLAMSEDGTEVVDDSVTPIPRPVLPVNSRFSAYVILSNGQTTIVTANDVEDARDFLSGDTSSIPATTEEGQVFMTNSILQPEWVTPVISEDDTWMVGDDYQLVWE